jgi:hypothetical protein
MGPMPGGGVGHVQANQDLINRVEARITSHSHLQMRFFSSRYARNNIRRRCAW